MACISTYVPPRASERSISPGRSTNGRGGYLLSRAGSLSVAVHPAPPVVARRPGPVARRSLIATVCVVCAAVFAVVGLLRPTASTGQSGRGEPIVVGDGGGSAPLVHLVTAGETAWGVAARLTSGAAVGRLAAAIDVAAGHTPLAVGSRLEIARALITP